MEHLVSFLGDAWPLLALGALLVLAVVIINTHGRRLAKHEQWMARVEVRVDNLHRERRLRYARSLQSHRFPPTPGTILVRDEELIFSKDTKPYPEPPPGKPKKEGPP